MALIAGVDIGNSTTEIVIVDGREPLAWEQRSTHGRKGSEASVRSAAALLRNIEHRIGVHVEQVVVAPWQPVATEIATVRETPPDTGNIQMVRCADHSVSGNSWAVGTPWNISISPPQGVPVVAIVESETGYRQAAGRINDALEQGIEVTAVVVADDEAVLVASRLSRDLPVVDRADCRIALGAKRLFVEVRPAGQCISAATDVWALHSVLGAQKEDVESLNLLSRRVRDLSAVVIGVFDEPIETSSAPANPSVVWSTGDEDDLIEAIPLLRKRLVGSVRALNLERIVDTADVWGVDVDSVLADRGVRDAGHLHRIALASLSAANTDFQYCLGNIFSAPVAVAKSESEAALIGARTTPGLPREALILDIGGGTIDLVSEDSGISAAGAGELLSAAVAEVLGVPKGFADWIKRGPAQRVDSTQVRLSESGSYDFVTEKDTTAPANALGMLVAQGPVGLLPFGRNMQPAEWRIIRQSLKLEIISRNVSRILRTYRNRIASDALFDIVVVGGPAADDELLPAFGRLPEVRGLGRGNVAGKLGHRFAVAYGLTQIHEFPNGVALAGQG